MMAAQRRGSVKVLVQPLKLSQLASSVAPSSLPGLEARNVAYGVLVLLGYQAR